MSDAYVIEVQGQTVGIIVRFPQHEPGYRFLASLTAVNELEGQSFQSPWHAERAARELMTKTQANTPVRRKAS